MVCSLFGHRECEEDMQLRLYEAAEELVRESHVDCFFVGNHGGFDEAGIRALSKLKERYPHLRCYVVSAYSELGRSDASLKQYGDLDAIYPLELSILPRGAAIPQRNKWMARQADVILCSIDKKSGGAVAAVRYAKRLEKRIVNIGSIGDELDMD